MGHYSGYKRGASGRSTVAGEEEEGSDGKMIIGRPLSMGEPSQYSIDRSNHDTNGSSRRSSRSRAHLSFEFSLRSRKRRRHSGESQYKHPYTVQGDEEKLREMERKTTGDHDVSFLI